MGVEVEAVGSQALLEVVVVSGGLGAVHSPPVASGALGTVVEVVASVGVVVVTVPEVQGGCRHG